MIALSYNLFTKPTYDLLLIKGVLKLPWRANYIASECIASEENFRTPVSTDKRTPKRM